MRCFSTPRTALPFLRPRTFTRYNSTNSEKPWRIVGALCMEKMPVIVHDLEPWETKFQTYKIRKDNKNARKLPAEFDELDDIDEMGIEEATFDATPKISKFDINDDVTSPNRCLADSLYLVIRKNRDSFDWEFPQLEVADDEFLVDTIAKVGPNVFGNEVRNWTLGRAPIGHYEYVHEPGHPKFEKYQGTKVFIMHGLCLNPEETILLDNTSTVDYVWATKEELIERYFDDNQLADLCRTMISKNYYSPYTFYDEDYDHDEQNA